MLTGLYKTIMSISGPFLKAHLEKRLKKGKEDELRIKERFGISNKKRGDKKLIWFHAASVGESISLLDLINQILNDYPKIEIMITTGTVTSARVMEKRLPPKAFHQFIPLDHPKWTRAFINHWKPDLVIWTESEFWPNILMDIKNANIPAVLLNARMSEKSFKKWSFAKGLIKNILSTFDICFGQNESEAKRLNSLGAKKTEISDNLKYTSKPLPYNEEQLEVLKGSTKGRNILLWAATHSGEEEIACALHKKLSKTYPKLLTIILPRHPQRLDEIKDIANKFILKFSCRSKAELPRAEDDIYIADTIGETGLFFKLTSLCIIGGSFVDHGGHNIIEPAWFDCQIFYGPHMFNFISICEDFENSNSSLRVADAAELAEKLKLALKDNDHFADMAENAKDLVRKKSHVLENIMESLKPFIDKALEKKGVDLDV